MGYTSYKLSDCANASNIIYTSTDLSDYVNQVVEIDCPGCWYVEEFNLQPPTDLAVVVSNVFIDCQTCEQEYWRLTDCAGIEEDIITITDLSLYQDKVITLTWCPKICWSITSTRETTNSTIVFVENEYDLCLDCITDVNPCICSTITNLSDTSQVFSYFDCGGKEQRTSSLKPGQISDKFCARKINAPENYIIQYGECSIINGNDYKCPTVPLPKRTVTPGYNTPACTTEYFDKVSCAYAEVMYSIALEQRYGITSCCAEELEKWEIKYELLMMAAILDPDYVCTPSSTCCDPGLPKSTGTCNS